MPFSWRGRDGFDRRLDEASRRFVDAARQGVAEVTAEIQGKAALDAPVDEGTLRASASFFVDGTFRGRTGAAATTQGGPETAPLPGFIRGVIGFNVPYAAIQHEHTEYRHPKGGRAKYLELALRKVLPRVGAVISSVIRKAGFG